MKTLYFLFALAVLFTSCKDEPSKPLNEPVTGVKEVAAVSGQNAFITANLELQRFTIDANENATVNGKNGVILRIPKNVFADGDGNPAKGKVTIELKEALSMTDIVKAGLTTLSDGKLLETGGMIYINATAQGKTLHIADNKGIEVMVPAKKKLPGMQIFNGVTDSLTGSINWVNPKDIILKGAYKTQVKADVVEEFIDEFTGDVPSLLKPVEYTNPKKTVIEVNFDNPEQFPEFGYYKNVKWQLVDQSSYTEGDAEKDWYHVKVDRGQKPGVYRITFRGRGTNGRIEKEYDVIPVFEGQDYDEALAAYNKKFAEIEKERMEQEKKARAYNVERIRTMSQQQKQNIRNQKETDISQMYANSYIFTTQKIGWINCDRFTNDPAAQEAIVEAGVTGTAKGQKTFAYMVFTNRNICIPGYQNEKGLFRFGTDKLPIGDPVVILAVSSSGGKTWFASQKATISKELSITLSVEEITRKKMQETIDSLTAINQ